MAEEVTEVQDPLKDLDKKIVEQRADLRKMYLERAKLVEERQEALKNVPTAPKDIDWKQSKTIDPPKIEVKSVAIPEKLTPKQERETMFVESFKRAGFSGPSSVVIKRRP